MPLRSLLGEGPEAYLNLLYTKLDPRQIFLGGVRALDSAEQQFINAQKLQLLTSKALINQHFEGPIYLHLDLDLLDPDEYPYSLMPTPGGWNTKEVAALIDHYGDQLVGATITESVATEQTLLTPIIPLLDQLYRAIVV
jgi:arginase